MQRKRYLLSGLIALFVLFGLIMPQGVEARDIIINAATTLAMDPTSATATTCGTTDVYVKVNDVVDLTAYHLEVTYDRTKVQVVSVVNGGFLASPAENGLLEPTNTLDDGTGTGRLLFGMAQQGVGGDPNPKTGSGNLIKITLKSLATTGTTNLTIDGSKSMLVDWPEAQPIPFTVTGGTTVTLQSCAPTDITLSNAAVAENLAVGTLVGTLGASDPDVADTTFTYSLVDTTGHPDNAKFQIVGSQLQTNAIFDFETDNSYEIMIRATGPNGLTYDEAFTIAVNDVNDAPVLAVIGAKSVVNTGTLTFTATATDQDLPAQTLTFSVKDAPATATINSSTGAFSWAPTVATDAGIYNATICVSDGALEDCETITITVTDGEAPTVVSGVAYGVAPYGDVTMVGTNFAVPQGFVVSTIQFTISEPVTIVGSNVVYMGTVPYGTMAVSGSVVTVTPYPNNEIAAQLGTFTFNVDAGSIEDLAGNALANLSATLTVTDQTSPVMEEVLPAEGLITLGLDDTFVLMVDAFDLNLFSLEVDHSFEGTLPEFTVYASATNPWGSTAAKDAFDAAGMTVAYDETAQKWTINFGEAITDTHFIPNGVIFYMVLHDEADNKWGSMSPTSDENTYAYTFEVTNTLEPEITSAVTYVYSPVYNYVGDVVFDDPNNIFTATFSPAEFLAGGAVNDLARYLGALYRQDTSTVIKITFNGVEYTWDTTGTLKGSNWEDASGNTLVSAMAAYYFNTSYDPAVGMPITVHDGWHTADVTFKLLITNTLDDEIESAPSYVYDPVYTYVGTRVFDDATNIYTVTYDDVEFNPNAMYDLARYLGALYRQDDSTVTSIVYDGVTYTWDAGVGLQGSNWVDSLGNTLVSKIVDDFEAELIDPAVGLILTVSDGVHTENVTFKFVVTDTTAPTIVSGVAVGATGFAPVTAGTGLTFTVPQGYTVDHIEITMSEAVQIVAPGIVYFEGNPYGTMSASGNVLTITPYAGNEIAGIPGTFDFGIDAGSIEDLAGNDLATLTATMVVEPSLIFNITDFGMWGETWPGAYSLGWGYVPLFDTTTIANIEVGMLDVDRNSIVTYTADDEQIVWQLANGWIPTPPDNLSSAPFYRVYNGNPIAEGEDLDWTVIFGSAFDSWSPRWGYVEVTDIYGTTVYHEIEYTGPLGDLTAPTVGEATAIGVDPYDDVTAENLTFTVPQGYTVERIDFTMSEPVTVVAGTEVTLAGVPYGLVTVSADGMTLTVTPYTGNTVANLIGPFTFEVPEGKIFDLSGNPLGTLEATMIVTNVAPVAMNDAYTVAEDGVLSVAARGVLINDTDFDPSILTAILEVGPANGTLTLNADGSFTYTPAADFNGTDSFTYKANDGITDSNVATVTITVTPVNDAPVLALIGPQAVANTATLTITPSASDVDGDTLTWSLGAGAPEGAIIDPETGAFSWAPGTATTPGTYSATICVSDGTTQACETVTITVTDGVAPVLTSVSPPEGDVYLAAGENFVLTVDALDDNLRELEIDHSMEGSLPEFSVYASESDPYGGDEADFIAMGVSVAYDTATQTWAIDFGAALTTTFIANPDGITFYLVLKDEAGNQWGTMYGTTPENTFAYNLILDDVAPVMEAVTPPEGDVYLAGGENFVLTVDALDTNLYSLEIDHSFEGTLPEFTVYASESDPYGGDVEDFAAAGVTVTYDDETQTWVVDFGSTITNNYFIPDGVTFYLVLEDMAGNTWGTMYGTTPDNTYEYDIVRDDVDPVLVSVTPPHDSTVLLGIGDTFELTIVALDDNLRELEIDHSMEGTLPEFSVYASEGDPYGGDGADFGTAGVTVTFDAATQTWVIDFGATISAAIANNGGITFYLVLEDMAGNTWGSMSPTTPANTFKYIVSQDLVIPTIGSGVANSTTDGNVNLVDGKFTVNQGYVVDTIEITMNEPVLVDLGTVVSMVGYGPYGTITANVDDVITITPITGNEIAAMIGSFTFTVPDGSITDLSGNPFTGSIGLEVLNVAPVAVNDAYIVAEDGVLTVAARGVLINDTDFDPSILTAVTVTGPANGSLMLNADGSFTYTPDLDFNGTDTFTYKANDGIADSNVATVTITVTAVNDTPVAVNDTYSTSFETATTITAPGVLTNDTDVDEDSLTAVLVTDVANGTLTLAADGSFTYTPDASFAGVDTFTYKANDGLLDSNVVTVAITVTAYVNTPPVAVDDSYWTDQDVQLVVPVPGVLDNDYDVDDDNLTATLKTNVTKGTLVLLEDGSFTYTPNAGFCGIDSFVYTLVSYPKINSDGWTADATATITIYCDPIISSDNLPGPYEVGQEQGFQVTLTNLEYGHDFTNVLARFRLEDITLADIASFLYLETALEPDAWMPLPLTQDGDDVIGDFGPASGFPMPAPYSATSQFKVTFNTPGTYPASIVLYDVAADPDVELDTYTADVVVVDLTSPVVTIIGATADGVTMDGNLEDGFILPTTNDPDIDHLLQITATVDEPLADDYFGLYFVEAESTVTAEQLKAYYAAKPVPSTPLDFLGYLNDAADGLNPFVYIKEDLLALSLVDAAKHDLMATDVDMTVPDTFPLGTYVVRGVLLDEAGNETTVTLTLIVTGDRDEPVVTIIGATADGVAMDGNLEDGFILPTTNDPDIDHLLQVDASVDEPLADEYFSLYFVEAESTVTAEHLKAYYAAKPVPSTPLDFLGYLNDAADGLNPFVYIKEDLLALSLADAAKHDLMATDVDMTVPDTFPLGTYVVRGVLLDEAGNETTVTLTLIVTGDRVAPVVDITGASADGVGMAGNLEDGYILPTTNDPAIDHLLQINATVDAPLANEYFGLKLIDSTVSAEDLKAYYAAKPVPEPYLSYLNSAADGVNPFVYIKGDGLVLSLVDAAKHDLGGVDVPMTVPDTFPLGTYTVQGVVRDLAGNQTTVTFILIVTGDRVEPVVSIIGATADGDAMAGNLEDGYILEITNDQAADDHLLQIDATVNETLADEFFGLYFVESESTVTAAQLKAYYDARGVPSTPLDFLGYLKGAADGTNPFVFIKEDALSLSLVDAAKHALMGEDVDMTIPDDFPVGKYVVRGVVADADGNETTVTLILIVRWTEETALAWLQDNTVLSSETGMVDDLTATFPLSIPPVIVEEDYVIDSRMTLAAPLPAGSTITVFRDGVQILTDITLSGTGPFWFTELFTPDAPRAGFNDNYAEQVENYSIIVTRPAGLAADFDTTVLIESVISKDDYLTETVLDDITLGIHLDDAVAPIVGSGVAKSTADGNVNLVDGKFTVDQGYVVDTIDITMSEPVLVEIGTVVTMVGYGPYGTITANVDDVITITPYAGNEIAALIGSFSFTAPVGAITDLSGNPFTGSIGLEVLNVAPVAVDDAYSVAEDGVLTVAARGVLTNDTDFDPSILTAVLVTGPSNGTLVLNADGSFTYTPAANFHGTVSFTYKANDGLADSNVATVTITVSSVNDSPVAVDDAYTVAEDTLLSIAAPGVLANDSDIDGDVLNATVRTNPSHGALTLNGDGSFTYLPNPDWHGTDSFTYNLITHPAPTSGWTDWATVTITVTPVNDAPVLDPIPNATIPEMVAYTFTATATDVDSTNLTFSLVGAPAGAAINASTGVFTWTPTEAQGPQVYTFTVKVCDDATPSLCDQQSVKLTVTEVNRAPEIEDIEDQEVTVGEELTFTAVASDPDLPANTLTFRLEEAPAGAAIDPTTGKFTWTPVESQIGEHEFHVCVTDGQLNDCTLVKVTVLQGHVNTPPVAVADTYVVDQDQVLTIAAPGVLANDTDADNDTLTAILVSTTSNGTLTFNVDGSFVYTPRAEYFGTDTFTYKANDGKADSNVVTVTITVRKVEPVMPYQMYYPVIFQGW